MGSSSICDLTLAGFSYELDHNNNNSNNNNNKKDEPTKEEKNTFSLKYDNLFAHIPFGSLLSKSYGNNFEVEKTVSLEGSDEDENARPRKKLRLTKEQSDVLEDRFKHHSTLNPVEKQALSRQLNLRQRQVEVWFQNRRARTKLKQTELNVESLKMCLDSLAEDNERLHKEIEQLKAFKFSSAHATTLFMPMPPATVTICSSCGRISTNVDGGADTRSKPSVVIKPKARSCSRFVHT